MRCRASKFSPREVDTPTDPRKAFISLDDLKEKTTEIQVMAASWLSAEWCKSDKLLMERCF